MHHGGPSAKRTWLWSNMPEISEMDRGTLSKAEREEKTKVQTVRKYRDSKGKSHFVGLPALSSSQNLAFYMHKVHFNH